jgi:phosphoribosylanthranilate isomerase
MKTRVKICGITNSEDAEAAVNAGADALGFVFFQKSPRCISPGRAKEIVRSLPPFVTPVGVFVNEDRQGIEQITEITGIRAIQMHGDESPEFCRSLCFLPTIKAFRVRKTADISLYKQYHTNAWLLDTYSADQYGGTGKTFSWEIAKSINRLGIPIILAGGLTPDNISRAIEEVKPYAVDVSSGLEMEPGKKDPTKIKDLFEAIGTT